MDYELTVGAIARRAETMSAARAVVAKTADGDIRRETWADTIERARRLGSALQGLGIEPGNRVASLCWNQSEHLDAYFGVPMMGGVLHTVNPRLAAASLARILEAAESRLVIVDASLLALWTEIEREFTPEFVVTIGVPEGEGWLDYARLLDAADPVSFVPHPSVETDACTLCFTTGTTGAPKGVLYSHRSVSLQALSTMTSDFGGVCAEDTILVMVPMFHGNAWNQPYAAALAGSAIVLPHADLRVEPLLATIEAERVTVAGGVPTVWQDVLTVLDAEPDRFDLSSLRIVRIGGDRMPPSLLQGLVERHGLPVSCGFGMTEVGPVAGIGSNPNRLGAPAEDWQERAKTGWPLPFLEIRARGEEGLVPWDDDTVGELEYRGPSVARGYWKGVGEDAFAADGWLRSGDLAAIAPGGRIDIRDRSKDLIKSGGEWISAVALEHALETHPGVGEVAVIGIPDERWQERPLGVVVAAVGDLTAEELRAHLKPQVPRWWLPERFEIVDELPRTDLGKVKKNELRERFGG